MNCEVLGTTRPQPNVKELQRRDTEAQKAAKKISLCVGTFAQAAKMFTGRRQTTDSYRDACLEDSMVA